MKKRELLNLGIPAGEAIQLAIDIVRKLAAEGTSKSELRKTLQQVAESPSDYLGDPMFGGLATALTQEKSGYQPRQEAAPWREWGVDLDEKSRSQMRHACELPITTAGALMPDAHVGYGLPIGGVLATKGAVIPYAVGVDIACRMKLTVLDLPPQTLDNDDKRLCKAIEQETKFGVGAAFRSQRRQHDVLDRDWSVSPITKEFRDKAWAQLGTSGSGNHFVEFGTLTLEEADLGLEAGRYLALLSHSGSRGTGAAVCAHYSRRARELHQDLPKELQHLAWLDLDSADGQEYWEAMQLMGHYAAGNHSCIHRHIAENLGVAVLADIENHHNFAWKEVHGGQEVVVHRKGATPAGQGVLGIIPGSMATPGYVVRGKGSAASLNSCSHGAGRVMSRTQAKKELSWKDAKEFLKRQRVKLLSAGLDEVPMVYKDIATVMGAQQDLVETIARFDPRLVKMAPAGERPED